MRRLVLVCHAATAATYASAFPGDEPLDARASAAAARLSGTLPRCSEVLSSPALRCRETARAAGLVERVEPEIAECDFGSWSGQTLAAVQAREPDAVSSWMQNPQVAPHGGETLAAFTARVGRWLDDQAVRDGLAVVITHAGVVRASIVQALAAPLESFWRIDAAPLAATELHARDGRWIVTRVNCALSERGPACVGS